MLKNLHQSIDGLLSPELLLLIDSEVLTEGRDAPARELLGHGRHVNNYNQRKNIHRVSGYCYRFVYRAGFLLRVLWLLTSVKMLPQHLLSLKNGALLKTLLSVVYR